jgi:hypothetical protein
MKSSTGKTLKELGIHFDYRSYPPKLKNENILVIVTRRGRKLLDSLEKRKMVAQSAVYKVAPYSASDYPVERVWLQRVDGQGGMSITLNKVAAFRKPRKSEVPKT